MFAAILVGRRNTFRGAYIYGCVVWFRVLVAFRQFDGNRTSGLWPLCQGAC